MPNLGSTWVVGDDRDLHVDDGQQHGAADQVPVALVVGVHGDGGVAQHRLDPGGGDDDRLRGIVERAVADGHQFTGILRVLDLDVGQRGVTPRAPVDDPLRAVDQPVVEELLEDRLHRGGQALVEGESLPVPVDGIAQPLHLPEDGSAGFGLPVPDLLHEQLAAEVVTGLAVDRQLPLHHVLGGDPGMVHARQPEHLVTRHPVPAGEDVHQRVIQGMADVQGARDIGRRQHDRERPLRAAEYRLLVRPEVPGSHPALVQRDLYRRRVVLFRQFPARQFAPIGGGSHPASLGALTTRFRTPEPRRAITAMVQYDRGSFRVCWAT